MQRTKRNGRRLINATKMQKKINDGPIFLTTFFAFWLLDQLRLLRTFGFIAFAYFIAFMWRRSCVAFRYCQKLSFKQHVDIVVRSCFYQLRQLRSVRVRRSVPDDATPYAHSGTCVRQDYCNAVLYGVSAKVARRLQAVLLAAAWLITGVRRNQHTSLRHCVTRYIGCRCLSA